MGKLWKWEHCKSNVMFHRLKISTHELSQQTRESLLSEFRAYHGRKYEAVIDRDRYFGAYVAKINEFRS